MTTEKENLVFNGYVRLQDYKTFTVALHCYYDSANSDWLFTVTQQKQIAYCLYS
jgi:hypothetical protein